MRTRYFFLSGDDNPSSSTQRFFSVAKLPLAWPSLPVLVPHRLRRRFRSTRSKIRSMQSPTSSIASLNTSLNPADTLRALRTHHWSYYDAQYLFLALVAMFSLCVIQSPGAFAKTLIVAGYMALLIIPMSRQFFLPFLPIGVYLLLFYSCQFISAEFRPPIWVRVLPTLENMLYGASLSNILSAHKNTFLNVAAWIPYGLCHIPAPFVVGGLTFLFGPPGTTPVFARCFGWMNVIGVLTQILIPCSPPWYENMYGLAPANYSIHGSPAGLRAIDELLGIDLYTSTFTASPVVFGAFPSLHSADATMEALFMSHTFPKLQPLFVFYLLWLWWSTMYLSHHYAIDLVAGSLIAITVYFMYRGNFLPRLQAGKMFRWDYDYVELGDTTELYAYGLTDLDDLRPGQLHADSDEWTIGSSSSFSSSSREPSTGMRSPATEERSSWEGETVTSSTHYGEEGREYQKA